jgi:membrane associated rhomboid family serine protease
MPNTRRHLILFRGLFPFTFVVILWLIQLAQGFLQTSWADYSLYPRTVHGLIGIFTCPLLHANFSHLLGNTVPLLILGFLLWSNYREIAGKVFWLIYFCNGILLWCFARDSFHLGASGVVYGLAFFLFFSGFIRKIPRLTMLSFLLIFIYGSMVWGIFPFDPTVSWEGHLYGALSGIIFAYVFRKQGPQPVNYWKDEDEIESLDSELTEEEKALLTPEQIAKLSDVSGVKEAEEATKASDPQVININYDYKPKSEDDKMM